MKKYEKMIERNRKESEEKILRAEAGIRSGEKKHRNCIRAMW